MATRAPIVALEGSSGVGKSTLAAAVAERYGWPVVAEAADRLEPPPSLAFRTEEELLRLERQLLSEDARRFAAARELARRYDGVLVDTGFLGTVTYTAGLVSLGRARPRTFARLVGAARALATRGRLGVPDLSVLLEASAPTVARRLRSSLVRHPVRLQPRHAAVGRFEARVAVPWLRRQLPGRVVSIRASGAPRELAERVVRRARRVAPIPGPCRAAARLLQRGASDLVESRPVPRQPL